MPLALQLDIAPLPSSFLTTIILISTSVRSTLPLQPVLSFLPQCRRGPHPRLTLALPILRKFILFPTYQLRSTYYPYLTHNHHHTRRPRLLRDIPPRICLYGSPTTIPHFPSMRNEGYSVYSLCYPSCSLPYTPTSTRISIEDDRFLTSDLDYDLDDPLRTTDACCLWYVVG
ncbi:hypothetical protein BDY19DRAFT_943838 [Irpex rosettiformis]|uniref:Uncharacterized protein n=1 Tax=Irpex rosettiformis TaxID=378272 RepID=A0ACB8U655_9APHY|nr:hypothetical protein BDY19DRAFT_943838 [Irpex rosettiformis]